MKSLLELKKLSCGLRVLLIIVATALLLTTCYPVSANGGYTLTALAATNVGTNSATLNGQLTVLNGIGDTDVHFEYGLTTSYGNTTGDITISPGSPFSIGISGLTPGTTYHYRAAALMGNWVYSLDMTFTTQSAPSSSGDDSGYWHPKVVTIGSSNITDSSATVSGNLTSLGSAKYNRHPSDQVKVYFKYGTKYYQTVWPLWAGGNVTPSQIQTVPGEFSANIANLNPDTTYYFRAVAKGDGTAFGKVQIFRTALPATK